jgi:hypothetical protein
MTTDAHKARRTSASLAKTLKHLHTRSKDTADTFARDLGYRGKNPRQSMDKIFRIANGVTYKRLERFEKRLGVPTGIILCISHAAALVRIAEFDDDPERKDRAGRRLDLMVDYLDNLRRTLMSSKQKAPVRHGYQKAGKHDDEAWLAMLDELMEGTRGDGDARAPTEFTGREFRKRYEIELRVVSQPAQKTVKAPRPRSSRRSSK